MIDVSRNEQRFMIAGTDLSPFLAAVSHILSKVYFSDNSITRTIYFNDDDYSIPWGYSLKARKFVQHSARGILPDLEGIYRVDIKSQKGFGNREKAQRAMRLGNAAEFLLSSAPNVPTEIRPYIAVEYLRDHFISKTGPEIRLTIDRGTTYEYFPPDGQAPVFLGQEGFLRIELKAAPDSLESDEYRRVVEIISQFSPLPIISKREYAFSLVSIYTGEKFGTRPPKELKDFESEAKFLVLHPNPAQLLLELKNFFRTGNSRHILSRVYPFTLESATVNHYWAQGDGHGSLCDGLKLQFFGSQVRSIMKRKPVVATSAGQSVLEREEIKGEFLACTDMGNELLRQAESQIGKLTPVGYLYRSRRAFWPETSDTGRIFHLSIDRCQTPDDQTLWQMEIEYVARNPGFGENGTRRTILREVGELAEAVVAFCNRQEEVLAPTSLTKFNWLLNQSSKK